MHEQPDTVAEVRELRDEVERLRRELAAARRIARRSEEAGTAAAQREKAERASSAVRAAAAEMDAEAAWERAAELGASLGRRIAEGQAKLIAAQSAAAALENANTALSEGQATLALREADLRAVIESAIDCAIVTTDRDGLVLAWNPGARRLLGWEEDAALRMSLAEAVAPEDQAGGLPESDIRSALSGERLSREGWLRRRDGRLVWAGIEAMALRADEEDQPVGILWMLRDRSAAREIELRREESEARLHLAIKAADLGTWELDLATDTAAVRSLRHDQMFGYEVRQPEWGQAIAEQHVLEEDRPLFRAAFARARETGVLECEVRVRWPDGSIHWIAPRGRTFYDVAGRPVRISGVVADITLRKQAEEVLRAREERLRGVLEGMAEGFGLLAPDFTILEHNREALRMDGRPREQIIGRSHWEVYPGSEDSELGRLLKHAMAERVPVSLEHCYAWEDGHAKWLDMRAYPMSDGALAVFWRDVTDRRAAEDALREEETKYRTLFQSMDEGYLLAEVLFDAEDRPCDIRYLEANAAAIRMIGSDPTGRLLREVDPGYEPYWNEILGRVARSGQGERLERYAAPTGTWYDFYVFKPEPQQPGSRRVAVVFQDVTARREAEDRQAFLLRLSDALRPLNDPVELQRTAARLLAGHLGVVRAAYFEMEADEEWFVQAAGHEDGAVGLPARMRMSDYGPDIVAAYRAGQPVAVADIEADPRFASQRAAYRAIGVRAWAGVPLVKEGRLVAILGVHAPAARAWTQGELQLLEEVAQRSWAAVELARLRRSASDLNAFLLRFSEAVRGLTEPQEVAETACRLVAEALDAERAYWSEVDWATRDYVIGAAFSLPGVPVVSGRFPLDAWAPFTALQLAGHPVVLDDTQADARGTPAMKEALARIAVGADLATPVLADGRLRCVLTVNQRLPRRWTPEEVALVQAIAGRCWAEVERARAEAALRASEERYRALFTSIDAGFCIVEVRFDAPDGRADYRVLEANPAFHRQTGLPDPILGRWLREAAPALEEHWYETYGRVARTGEAARFEQGSDMLGRWFDVYAFRIGAPEQRRVAILFNDITVRRQAEESLRASEERQAFLLKFSDALRAEPDADAVAERAIALLLSEMRLDRCYVGVYRVAEDRADIPHQAGNSLVPPLPASIRLSDFPEAMRVASDRTLVIEDFAEADGLSDTDRRSIERLGLRSLVAATLRAGENKPLWTMVAASARPRRWTTGEIALLEEAAERTWAAMGRARAEAALRESEERFRGFAENSADVLWIADAAGTRLQYLSPAYDTVFGAAREDALADIGAVRALVHPDDRAAYEAAMPRTRKGETMRISYRVIRPSDGRTVHLLDTGFAVRGPDGAIRQVAGIVQDVTDQRRMQAELAERERHLRALVEGVPHLLWRASANGLWRWASPQWTTFTGLSDTESQGHGWLAAVHPEDRDGILAGWQAVEAGGTFAADFRLRSAADGTWRWFRSRGIPLRGGGSAIAGPPEWLGTSTDVDDQIRAREALERGKDELEARVRERTAELMAAEETLRQAQKLEAVGQLTGGIAHDFNNMLQGVAGALDMARRRMEGKRLEDAGRYLEAARDATGRAAGLTRRLLAFARRQQLEPRQVNADRLVREMEEMLRRTMGPAIALELDLCDGRGVVTCDANELESALLNLCINARDAMPDGGRLVIATRDRRLTAADLFSDAEPGEFVEVSVADTGAGMSPEVRERVLEPFFTTKPLGQGTGLGLSQVYGFVRQSGGTLRIESAPGRGTTVRLWLPLTGRRAEADGEAEGAAGQGALAGGSATLLLVDDETGVRVPSAEHLRDLGYRVVEAPDGPTALRLLEEGLAPDMLVTDVGLPGGMDGVRLAEAVLERRPGLPILFTTGYAAVALPEGAEVIPKPYPLDTLALRVRTGLAAAGRAGIG